MQFYSFVLFFSVSLRFLLLLIALGYIFTQSNNESAPTHNLINAFLSQLINFSRYFPASKVTKAELSSLIIPPWIEETIDISGCTKGFSTFTKRQIFELDALGGDNFDWALELAEFTRAPNKDFWVKSQGRRETASFDFHDVIKIKGLNLHRG